MAFELLKNMAQDVEAMKQKIQELAQTAIKPALEEAIKEFRKSIPTLQSIWWPQFRPYFNDGDACLFSVHGVYGTFVGDDPDDEYQHDLYGDEADLSKKQNNLLSEFANLIESLGDDEGSPLMLAFDDSVKVTIDIVTGEVSTEEYDHD